MSRLVIFDLETTERYPLGQILNLAAIAVDEEFNVIDKLYIDVKLSKTQIPSPDALLANRIKLSEHAKVATHNEREALEALFSFIDKHKSENRFGQLIVGGQNIARFDLEFVRSNALRSGLYPYFNYVVYCDLLFLSKKLCVTNEEFRNKLVKPDGSISLALDFLTKSLGISTTDQKHNALDDVLLTLDVYKHYAHHYDLNVFVYDPYEAKSAKIGDVYQTSTVAAGKLKDILMSLHWQDKNYSLWLNLSEYDPAKGKRNLMWRAKKNSSLIISEKIKDKEIIADAKSKSQSDELADISIFNYFEPLDCDAEMHPTSVDIFAIKAAVEYLNTGSTSSIEALQNKNSKSFTNMVTFIERYNMLYKQGNNSDKLLKSYLENRYSGKIKTQKNLFGDQPNPYQKADDEVYHPSLKERLQRIDVLLSERTSADDQKILSDLKDYILESPVLKICPTLLKE